MPKEKKKVNTKEARKSLEGKAKASTAADWREARRRGENVPEKMWRGVSGGATPKDDKYRKKGENYSARLKEKTGDPSYNGGKKDMSVGDNGRGYKRIDFSDEKGTGYRYYNKDGKFLWREYTRYWDEEEEKKRSKRDRVDFLDK